MKVKKWTHSTWQQTGKSSDHGSGMGSNENQKYLLFGKIPSIGSKTGQKTRPDSRRTFDPEVCLSYLERKEHYKELGADYLNSKIEAKRKTYLKKELEKLGFQVALNPLPDAG
jgi:hypothetical protein